MNTTINLSLREKPAKARETFQSENIKDQANDNSSLRESFLLSPSLAKRFQIIEKIGSGSFGQLYKALDNELSKEVALKIEDHVTSPALTLGREAKIIEEIGGVSGIPKMHVLVKEENYSVLGMELLGPNLERLFKCQGRKFSLKTILMIAEQILKRIEYVHWKGYLHRDIKPENFVIGHSIQNPKTVYLIDFGLSKKYKDETTAKHISYKENRGLIGTARYASISTHLGIEQSRRDDLEAIGYLLMYFFKGNLPWQNIKSQNKNEKYKLIADSKMNTPAEVLCRDAPREFLSYFNHVNKLTFTEAPDYKYLRGLFRKLMTDNNWTYDYEYDWHVKDGNNPREEKIQQLLQQQQKIANSWTIEKRLESEDADKNKLVEKHVPRRKLNSSQSNAFLRNLTLTSRADDSLLGHSQANNESRGCDSTFKTQSVNRINLSSQPNNQDSISPKKLSGQSSSPHKLSNTSDNKSSSPKPRHSWNARLSNFCPKAQDDAKVLSKVALPLLSNAKSKLNIKPLHLNINRIPQDSFNGPIMSSPCNTSRSMMPDKPDFSICPMKHVQDDDPDFFTRDEPKVFTFNFFDQQLNTKNKGIKRRVSHQKEDYDFAEEDIHEKDTLEIIPSTERKETPIKRLKELHSAIPNKRTNGNVKSRHLLSH